MTGFGFWGGKSSEASALRGLLLLLLLLPHGGAEISFNPPRHAAGNRDLVTAPTRRSLPALSSVTVWAMSRLLAVVW